MRRSQTRVPARKRRFLAVFAHMQHGTGIRIGHNRDIVMPLAKRGIIDSDMGHLQFRAARETPLDCALQDPICRGPTNADQTRNGRQTRLLQPVDHQRFVLRGVSRLRLGLRHRQRPYPMLRIARVWLSCGTYTYPSDAIAENDDRSLNTSRHTADMHTVRLPADNSVPTFLRLMFHRYLQYLPWRL